MLNHYEKIQNSCEGHFCLWMSQGGIKVVIFAFCYRMIWIWKLAWCGGLCHFSWASSPIFLKALLFSSFLNFFLGGRLNLKSYEKKSYTSLNFGDGNLLGFNVVSPSNIYFHKDSYRFYEVKFMSLFGAHNLQIAMFWRAGEK